MEEIGRVVFYKFIDENNEEVKKSYVFYNDGSAIDMSYEDGLKAANKVVAAKKIKDVDELNRMINSEDGPILTMSGQELSDRFNDLKIKPEINTEDIEKVVEENLATKGMPIKNLNVNPASLTSLKDIAEELEDEELEEELTEKKEPGKIRTFFRKTIDKIKKSRIAKKVAVATLAIAMCFGLYSCGARMSKNGEMYNSNINTVQTANISDDVKDDVTLSEYESLLAKTTNVDQKVTMQTVGSNLDYFNKDFADHFVEEGKDIRAALSFDEAMALQIAYNNYSKDAIKAIFNGVQMNESDYPHFSSQFDGFYKNATLQLMGAYVLETREAQVDSYKFVVSEEGQEFVKKYNEMFLQCKEATGSLKVELVNKFYQELYKDFPISEEVREIGISHSDSRSEVTQYKLAITPIVAASEILFQNLEIDHTLSDKAIKYFDDLGLCNLAVEQFEKAKDIILYSSTDDTQPLYKEFENAKIKELEAVSRYVIDDAHRNLSDLDAFKKLVNKQVECFENNENTSTSSKKKTSSSKSYTTTRTESKTTYRTETSTKTTQDRNEAVKSTSEEAVKKAEAEVDAKIEKENQANKAQAEAEAKKKQEQLQKEADEQAKKNEEEVKKDNQDFQDKINNANNTINNGGTVNEKDLGHGTSFDKEHSDSNGNLDSSVKDVTTNGSGTTQPLPDPNKTGAAFDAKAPKYTEPASSTPSTPVESSNGGFYTEEVKTNEQIVDEYINSLENSGEIESNKVLTK